MIIDRIKELEAAKAKVAALEAKISAERNAALSSLPAKYGFENVAAFISAVRAMGGKRRGRKPNKAAAVATGSKQRRRRAKITDATRAQVKKLVEAHKTGGQIAKALKISLPSVQNIKKTLGLVKKAEK